MSFFCCDNQSSPNMTSTLNLETIDSSTTQTYKDVSCDALVVDGITVSKSNYDKIEYLVTNQFSYDSTNPMNIALKSGTTMYMDQLLLTIPTFVKIETSSFYGSTGDVEFIESSEASVLNGFTQKYESDEWFASVTCVTAGNYDITFTFTATQDSSDSGNTLDIVYTSSSGSDTIVAQVPDTQAGIDYSITYSAAIPTGASIRIAAAIENGYPFGFSNGTLSITKSTPFSSTSVNSVTATSNNSSLFTLDSSVSNLTIGNNSLYISPSNKAIGINRSTIESGYKLAVNGGLNGNGNAIEVALTADNNMDFYSTSTSTAPPSTWYGLASNATSGSTVNWYFGKDNSNYNHGRLRFGYTGSANTANYISMGLAGGASIALDGTAKTTCSSAYLDTSNSSKITFPRIVQTNPSVMALRLSNGSYTYTNSATMKFNSIDSRLDNGTTGTTTFVNSKLGISYSTTTGEFTFTSSTKRYYHIAWQVAFNTVANSGYSVEGNIRISGDVTEKVISNRTELPYTVISGVQSSLCASGLFIGASGTNNDTFALVTGAIDDAGTAVTSPNSVTITNLNCTDIVITEI